MVGSPWGRTGLRNSHPLQSQGVPGSCRLCRQHHLVRPRPLATSTLLLTAIYSEFNRSTAASLIKHFRDCIKTAPRELYANVILTAGPRRNGALVVIQICWLGPKEGGIPILNAFLSWTGGQCLLNEVNEKTFANQQDSVAKVLKAAGVYLSSNPEDWSLNGCVAGRKWFLRSDVVTSLTDDLIHQTVEKFADTPDGCAWLFELAGGAMVDHEGTPIPKAIRQASFNIVAFHQWKPEEYDAACVDSAEEVHWGYRAA